MSEAKPLENEIHFIVEDPYVEDLYSDLREFAESRDMNMFISSLKKDRTYRPGIGELKIPGDLAEIFVKIKDPLLVLAPICLWQDKNVPIMAA